MSVAPWHVVAAVTSCRRRRRRRCRHRLKTHRGAHRLLLLLLLPAPRLNRQGPPPPPPRLKPRRPCVKPTSLRLRRHCRKLRSVPGWAFRARARMQCQLAHAVSRSTAPCTARPAIIRAIPHFRNATTELEVANCPSALHDDVARTAVLAVIKKRLGPGNLREFLDKFPERPRSRPNQLSFSSFLSTLLLVFFVHAWLSFGSAAASQVRVPVAFTRFHTAVSARDWLTRSVTRLHPVTRGYTRFTRSTVDLHKVLPAHKVSHGHTRSCHFHKATKVPLTLCTLCDRSLNCSY
jgi:hypothetical protein